MMFKKKFINKNDLEKAYKGIENFSNLDNLDENEDDILEKVEKLPDELFQIIGKVVSFIEIIDRIEEDIDENK